MTLFSSTGQRRQVPREALDARDFIVAPYLLHSIPSLLTSLVHVTWHSRALFTLLYVYTIVYVHRGGHQSCW